MTKEFENFKQIFNQKQNELNIQIRNIQKNQENEAVKKQAEERQKQIESDQRASENRKILEDAGVIKLFEEIRNSGIVKYSNMPLFEGLSRKEEENYLTGPNKEYYGERYITNKLKYRKISNYHPAKIIFGHENKSIELAFNGYYGSTNETDADSRDIYTEQYQSCKIIVLDNKKIGYETFTPQTKRGGRFNLEFTEDVKNEVEITNLVEHVAHEIAQKNI